MPRRPKYRGTVSLNAQACPTCSRLVLPSVRPDAMGMEYRCPDCTTTASTIDTTRLRAIVARLVIDLEHIERAADLAHGQGGNWQSLGCAVGNFDNAIDFLNDFLNP